MIALEVAVVALRVCVRIELCLHRRRTSCSLSGWTAAIMNQIWKVSKLNSYLFHSRFNTKSWIFYFSLIRNFTCNAFNCKLIIRIHKFRLGKRPKKSFLKSRILVNARSGSKIAMRNRSPVMLIQFCFMRPHSWLVSIMENSFSLQMRFQYF